MLVGNWGRGIDGLQGTFGMLLSMSVMLYNTCGIGNQPHQSTLHCDQMVHQANSLLKQKFLLLLANTGGVHCNNQSSNFFSEFSSKHWSPLHQSESSNFSFEFSSDH
jgi:hypothetical protein